MISDYFIKITLKWDKLRKRNLYHEQSTIEYEQDDLNMSMKQKNRSLWLEHTEQLEELISCFQIFSKQYNILEKHHK